MTNVDLSSYNLSELKGLQYDIEKAIEDRQQQEVQKAREQILTIVREAGVSMEELLAIPVKKAKKENGQKVTPQYRNPEDSSQTWTGRGRQPRWIAAGLASGKKLDDFRIK
jgi:DNA-binding protein H-NS